MALIVEEVLRANMACTLPAEPQVSCSGVPDSLYSASRYFKASKAKHVLEEQHAAHELSSSHARRE